MRRLDEPKREEMRPRRRRDAEEIEMDGERCKKR
jgi:hypothetical protein